MSHNSFYFILGREDKISKIELQSVLANFDFGFIERSNNILTDSIWQIKLNLSVDQVAKLMKILGGTVKIFQKIAPRDENIVQLLSRENFTGKIIFAISNYQKEDIDTFRLALSVKKKIKFGKFFKYMTIFVKNRGQLSYSIRDKKDFEKAKILFRDFVK